MSYKVGDWVKITTSYGELKEGSIGKVVLVCRDNCPGIEWLWFTNGHNCSGKAKEGHGWYVSEVYLEPRPFQKGDRVRLTKHDWFDAGEVVTLIEVEEEQDGKADIKGRNEDGIELWFDSTSTELISPVEEIEKNAKAEDDRYLPISAVSSTFIPTSDPQDYKPRKEGIMSMLRDIPKQIKKLLSPNLRAMYRMGWIDSELEMTGEGMRAMREILLSEYEEELGKMAQKEVKRIEKEEE